MNFTRSITSFAPSQSLLASADAHNCMISARKIITAEADALTRLAAGIDAAFANAVAILENIKGRVIVSGMGKSGHIARKFAATLSSTGKPAFFVHPAEASHGDLGMITGNDGVVALSNSGGTQELVDIIAFCRSSEIPLIGITQNQTSQLANHADVTLLIPEIAEACPHNLAPTTSTSMMLALCDAIAVVLFTRRNFSASDFHQFHPGGKLGHRLKRATELMRSGTAIPSVGSGASMRDAIIEMSAKRLGCVAVLEQHKLVGIITDGDLRRALGLGNVAAATASVAESANPEASSAKPAKEPVTLPSASANFSSDITRDSVKKYMTPDPICLAGDEINEEIIKILQKNKITVAFVTDKTKKIQGIVHLHDLL